MPARRGGPTGPGEIKAYDVTPDGSLSNRRLVRGNVGTGVPGSGNCDAMECDENGNIWVTGPGGVWVIAPAGELIGKIQTREVVGGLSWGGADLRTLFLMTSSTVRAIETLVGPAPVPPFDLAAANG